MFREAIEELERSSNPIWGPESFIGYLSRIGHKPQRTAAKISVDTLQQLDNDLRDADVMVLRLGKTQQHRGTGFVLVRSPEGVSDFFIDDAVLSEAQPREFLPQVSSELLFPFRLTPPNSEQALLNLGFASGLIPDSLKLKPTSNPVVPATGQSVYSFRIRPHSSVQSTLEHRSGQVQVDALFSGHIDDKPYLFVVEAKQGEPGPGLAKHKIVYPMLSLCPRIPPEMGLVGVYLRACRRKGDVHFWSAICDFPDPRVGLAGIDELEVRAVNHHIIPRLSLTTES